MLLLLLLFLLLFSKEFLICPLIHHLQFKKSHEKTFEFEKLLDRQWPVKARRDPVKKSKDLNFHTKGRL